MMGDTPTPDSIIEPGGAKNSHQAFEKWSPPLIASENSVHFATHGRLRLGVTIYYVTKQVLSLMSISRFKFWSVCP